MLNEAFLAISLAFGNTLPILSSFHSSQNIIQALPSGVSPLLQLPYMTTSVARSIEGPGAKRHMTVQQFMRLPDDKRRRLAVGAGLLSDAQYKTAVSVAQQIPVLSVEKAFFKVMGERFITPSSLVQFVVKARIIPPGSNAVPEVKLADLEDVDPDEDDVDALLGRASEKGTATPATTNKNGPSNTPSTPGIQPPLAYAPYFARDHSPRWHVFLADSKQGKISVPPFTFSVFPKPLFDPAGAPSFAMQTLKMQFQAPPQAGQYTFVMHLVCDSYIGTDSKMEITLVVEDGARAEEIVGEDEISEPEEGEYFSIMAFSPSLTDVCRHRFPRGPDERVEDGRHRGSADAAKEEEEGDRVERRGRERHRGRRRGRRQRDGYGYRHRLSECGFSWSWSRTRRSENSFPVLARPLL